MPAYGMDIGQNAAFGYRDWQDAVMGWYDEVKDYRYGEDPEVYLGKNGWVKIGHYTQVVQNTTYRIGCGFAECTARMSRYYFCNYAPGQYRIANPYTKGPRASACPDSSKDGLCDCGGKMCLNGGSFDIDTCACTCTEIYNGSNCEKLNCPSSDVSGCWNSFLPKDCQFSWVANICPYMCGICGGPNAATPPPVFVSKYGCTYQGQRPSAGECQRFGNKGLDQNTCSSRGGRFGCSQCEHNYIQLNYCPVMCGLCDAPCNEKMCQNKGQLDTQTCKCVCDEPFTGDICDAVVCPEEDQWQCQFFEKSYCTTYSNVPRECPYLCGLCTKL